MVGVQPAVRLVVLGIAAEVKVIRGTYGLCLGPVFVFGGVGVCPAGVCLQ